MPTWPRRPTSHVAAVVVVDVLRVFWLILMAFIDDAMSLRESHFAIEASGTRLVFDRLRIFLIPLFDHACLRFQIFNVHMMWRPLALTTRIEELDGLHILRLG